MTIYEAIREMKRRIRHAEQMVDTFTHTVNNSEYYAEVQYAEIKLDKWLRRLDYRKSALIRLSKNVY